MDNSEDQRKHRVLNVMAAVASSAIHVMEEARHYHPVHSLLASKAYSNVLSALVSRLYVAQPVAGRASCCLRSPWLHVNTTLQRKVSR